jgi:hypothetical protein
MSNKSSPPLVYWDLSSEEQNESRQQERLVPEKPGFLVQSCCKSMDRFPGAIQKLADPLGEFPDPFKVVSGISDVTGVHR